MSKAENYPHTPKQFHQERYTHHLKWQEFFYASIMFSLALGTAKQDDRLLLASMVLSYTSLGLAYRQSQKASIHLNLYSDLLSEEIDQEYIADKPKTGAG